MVVADTSVAFDRKLEEYPSNPILGPRHMGGRSPTLLLHTHACDVHQYSIVASHTLPPVVLG